MRHGQLMRDGRVGLSNVKYQDIDNSENYTDGKIGESAFYRWLIELKKQFGTPIKVIHDPFREDYSVLNPNDDFIIEFNNRTLQVEVRHKTRGVPPRSNRDKP
jgi:hypothetical protein